MDEGFMFLRKTSYIVSIIDLLEKRGVTGPSKGVGPRDILVDEPVTHRSHSLVKDSEKFFCYVV